MAAHTDRGIPLSALSPQFLHTNSTSHTWPFSAIAELADNAYDPDVSAKQFWVDKTQIKSVDCLTFMDNGAGMIYEKMHKMLSFGFSEKQTINGHVPVGLYGNGFKSGSMRLGKDAIVFSKTRDAMCVGMLSQTYLEKTRANNVAVPIVAFRRRAPNIFDPIAEHSASLQDILKYSLFQTMNDLYSELSAITNTGTMATTGTRIIIWNLRRNSTGQMEFDFGTDRYDIRIPDFVSTRETYKRPERLMESPPESDFSLRAYCSILYLKPRMQIIIRGQKVKTQLVSKNLAYIRKDCYRPNFHNTRVPITFGYNTKSKDHYGIMMYHKNRLIKAYERVGCQLKANNKGVGVIGVIECNFLKPTHNKQDFDYTDEYRKTITSVALKLEEYWQEIRFKREKEDPNWLIPVEDTLKRPDQNWVQCDKCLNWRKLPDGIDPERLPDQWFCHFNPDPQFRSCQVPQEEADSDDELSYPKPYRKERLSKIQLERQRQQMEDAKKREEMQRMVRLTQQNEELRRQHENLKRQLRQTRDSPAVRVSVPPPPLRSALATAPHSSSALSQAGPSPSSEGMPIITSVCSLSTPTRMKRMRASGLDAVEAKKGRSNYSPGMGSEAATASSPAAACPAPTVVIPDDDEEDCVVKINKEISSDDDDDDIVIDETKSTPKPEKPTFDISRVKKEHQATEVPGILMECSDDAAPEVPKPTAATAVATPTCSPLSPGQRQVSSTTQTEVSAAIKEENEEVKNTQDNREENRPEGEEMERTDVGVSSPTEEEVMTGVDDASEMCLASPQGSEEKEAREGVDGEGAYKTKAVNARMAEPQTEREGGEVSVSCTAEPTPRENAQLIEAQQQQDQLMELLEKIAKERDAYKDEVHQLIVKVEDLEQNLLQLTQNSVKKEQCHQACQTNDKSLQEQTLQEERDSLAEEKRQWEEKKRSSGLTLQPEKEKTEGHCSSQVSVVDDELALQVDSLLRDLDQCNMERDELKTKLGSLVVEKTALAVRMEQLQKELEELRKDGNKSPAGAAEGQSSAVDSNQKEETVDTASGSSPSCQTQANGSGEKHQTGALNLIEMETQGEEQPQTSNCTQSSSDQSGEEKHRLNELRRSVARLLVTFVPALDLKQVNYDCNVIDEILDQVLQEISQSDNGIDVT